MYLRQFNVFDKLYPPLKLYPNLAAPTLKCAVANQYLRDSQLYVQLIIYKSLGRI